MGYDIFLCTLGAYIPTFGDLIFRRDAEEVLTKVDYDYPMSFATLAHLLSVRYFGLLTSEKANVNSIFPYKSIKGQLERDAKDLGLR